MQDVWLILVADKSGSMSGNPWYLFSSFDLKLILIVTGFKSKELSVVSVDCLWYSEENYD